MNNQNISTKTPLLDRVNNPDDLKKLSTSELPQLAHELRHETVDAVSGIGGHLGASLGVVELTVALHYVFNTPRDSIIWDVGHQAYPHKILTERRDRIRTIRQKHGLSGFTKISESHYDAFGTGHSSTSISAALGMAVASQLKHKDGRRAIAVIGDGAMSAGMAFEGMNHAGELGSNLIVILNDNDMSIAPPSGALRHHLSRLVSSKTFHKMRDQAKGFSKKMPASLQKFAAKADDVLHEMVVGKTLFDALGFFYVGPIDGHNVDELVRVLQNVRDTDYQKPILIHCRTEKGKGYAPAEKAADKLHAVAKFDVATGTQFKSAPKMPAYTKVFAEHLIHLAQKDDDIVAITAAMPSGTGLDHFAKAFPDRSFDVGIAEQHAVTLAAGMAKEGLKPYATIYSTFLQRAYDQVVHDVAIQKLPVRFAIDRAGLVGADGATHAGSFDVAYLSCLPNMVVSAASDKHSLEKIMDFSQEYNDGPMAFRYPRGESCLIYDDDMLPSVQLGQGYVHHHAEGIDRHARHDNVTPITASASKADALNDQKPRILLLNFGARLQEVLRAYAQLTQDGMHVGVADLFFAKPIDPTWLLDVVHGYDHVVTIEEGSVGGFHTQYQHTLQTHHIHVPHSHGIYLPDIFVDHAKPEEQYRDIGMDAEHIADRVKGVVENKIEKKASCVIPGADSNKVAQLPGTSIG